MYYDVVQLQEAVARLSHENQDLTERMVEVAFMATPAHEPAMQSSVLDLSGDEEGSLDSVARQQKWSNFSTESIVHSLSSPSAAMRISPGMEVSPSGRLLGRYREPPGPATPACTVAAGAVEFPGQAQLVRPVRAKHVHASAAYLEV